MASNRAPSKATPNPLTASRWKKALELRLAGWTYAQIAEACGYSDHSSARYAIRRSMEFALSEPAEELRGLECARVDHLMSLVWPKKGDTEPAQENLDIGDPAQRSRDRGNREKDRLTRLYAKVDRVVKLMERRAKLMGIDRPMLHKVEAEIQTPPTELSTIILENKDARLDYLRALELASSGVRLAGGTGDVSDGGELEASTPSEEADRNDDGGSQRGD
jgi:hypothetical protein